MIYFLRSRARRRIKIGTTAQLSKRWKTLEAEHGPLKLLGVMQGGLAEEAKIHKRFARLRIEGEWFRSCRQLRAFIRAEAVPWDGKDEKEPIREYASVRVDAEIAAKARVVALMKKMPLAEYLTEALEDTVRRDLLEEGEVLLRRRGWLDEIPEPEVDTIEEG